MTGAFANVRLELPNPEAAINVPASALIFDQSGLRVATVGPDDRVVLKPVTIARDLGTEVEIATGLTAEDRVDRNAAGRHRVRATRCASPANPAPATRRRARRSGKGSFNLRYLILRRPAKPGLEGWHMHRCHFGPWFETRRCATLLTMSFRDIPYCDPSSPSFLTSAPHFSCSARR